MAHHIPESQFQPCQLHQIRSNPLFVSLTVRARVSIQVYASGDVARPSPNNTANHVFLVSASTKIHRNDLPPEPRFYSDLKSHPYGAQFKEAMKAQWDAILANKVVQGVPVKEATGRILPLTWVYKYKFDKHGYLIKFKARVCVRGDLQPASDLDTYAATLAARSFCLLMAIAAYFDLDAFQLDAVDAFLNGDLDETVFVQYPDGFNIPGQCLRLLKGLYGLRRSPRLWYKELSSTLREMGLRPILEEPCIFANDWLVVFFYVDDIALLARPSDRARLQDFIRRLQGKYKMHDLGELKWFLGIRVIRDRAARKLWLSQSSYCQGLAPAASSSTTIRPSIPIPTDKLVPNTGTATPQAAHA